jgi:hypothetical protein
VQTKRWFENLEQYTVENPVPRQLEYDKLSLVRVYPNGKTQPGWGGKEFVDNYAKNAFDPARALRFYQKYGAPFGIVMRSLPFLCVDIDGKNGGIETARTLNLPETFAERSKSNNGFHLFYRIPYTNWVHDRGFSEYPDLIGLVPGVDIKGTGVVFHHKQQRWNDLEVAEAPVSLMSVVGRARDARRAARVTRSGTQSLDPEELLMVHDELLTDLAGRFEVGKRNQKLFAIAARMLAAGVPHWDTLVYDRGLEIGLELDEIQELINNVDKYS